MVMALPNLGSFSNPTATATASAAATPSTSNPLSPSDDPSKKIRKPYTITKSRESWTEPEHDKFLEALQLFDRDWKKIEAFVGSKTVIQIRSHAQKYFLKVQKSGTNEHLPPPRPKRKAAHPYPQKATKSAPAVSQASTSFQASLPLPEPGFVKRPDSSLLPSYPATVVSVPSWTDNSVPPVSLSQMKDNVRETGQPITNNCCCSSNESTPRSKSTVKAMERTQGPSMRVLPDFAQVYNFIGSVFDPAVTEHLQKLKKMDRIDVETVLLLMRNLSINLTSPDFEHDLLLSYDIEMEKLSK
ncbi:protein REVEILLE 6 isoform X2 [Solanum dulcamara]|uniref:protein REVEILLE 6 isoform X2 n=1 Tax=Solanum dulcamara TaxID=45834 RepID=UPI002485C522|nr:protein REVEILLE 6 isoform X2 [Solanum dulcamara]